MKTSLLRVAAALAVPLLALGACTASNDSGDSRAGSGGSGGSAADAASSQSKATAPGARPAEGIGLTGDDGSERAGESTAPLEQRSVISTGNVTLRAKDVARARAKAEHVADVYAGQVTDQETTTGDDGRIGYARLVLRVPTASFAQAMADLEQVAELVDSSATTEDVSTQVIDVDERVKAARASIDRIRLLMSRAEKIADIMAIEAQLASREADLNALLRQQAHLADQTSLSTISVGIDREVPGHHARRTSEDSGFLAGLRGGWHALRGFLTGAATVVGALLPWVPIALLVGVPVWLLLRRSRPAPAPTPAAAPPAEG